MSEETVGEISPQEAMASPLPAKVEFEPISFEATPGRKAHTFCSLMHHSDAPVSFNRQVVVRLKEWHLIGDDTPENLGGHAEMIQIINVAKGRAGQEELDFREAFQRHPWNFDGSVEGQYLEEELADKFPRALELKQMLGERLSFLFRSEPGTFYLRLIVREDGRRQVLRIADSDRSVEAINQDAARAPSIVPNFEAVRFSDGKTGLLIEWIEGHLPTTEEEKALCLERSEELLAVPIDSYDLWAGNFLISEGLDPVSGSPKPYYIDQDIPRAIAQYGYSPETMQDRKTKFKEDRGKMR